MKFLCNLWDSIRSSAPFVFDLFNFVFQTFTCNKVCDMHGDAKHLNENLEAYAYTMLKNREEFILIKLESNRNGLRKFKIPRFIFYRIFYNQH